MPTNISKRLGLPSARALTVQKLAGGDRRREDLRHGVRRYESPCLVSGSLEPDPVVYAQD